jgi:hypothetical protein
MQHPQAAEEKKLLDDVASRDGMIKILVQESLQQKMLLVTLETELFQKAEMLGSLQQAMAQQDRVYAISGDLQRANATIQDLQGRKDAAEELLRSLRSEASAKGDAVEGLVCSLTRQAALAKEHMAHQLQLEAQCRINDDTISSLMSQNNASEVPVDITEKKRPQEVFPGVPKRVEEIEHRASSSQSC